MFCMGAAYAAAYAPPAAGASPPDKAAFACAAAAPSTPVLYPPFAITLGLFDIFFFLVVLNYKKHQWIHGNVYTLSHH